MSKKYPLIPKGKACRVDLTEEYAWGLLAGCVGEPNYNPYDFWDEYEKHYSWSAGWQKGFKGYKDIMGGNYEGNH